MFYVNFTRLLKHMFIVKLFVVNKPFQASKYLTAFLCIITFTSIILTNPSLSLVPRVGLNVGMASVTISSSGKLNLLMEIRSGPISLNYLQD